MMEGKAGQGKVPYKPEDGQANPDPAAKSRDFAGYGPTDGVDSEGSVSEASKLLSYEEGQTSEFNVRTGRDRKTRYTGDFNRA